jgi:hypothetical protein
MAGRIRYLPSYSILAGYQYSPPSWFKQRAIDVAIMSCILFPAYRRHAMRKQPIYKFLDVTSGEVIYYDNLHDYKEAIYNRIPEKIPEGRGYFFPRYEFDFRDRAYSDYLSYEPFFLRTRNWLTFNNWRPNRRHFMHRLKDNKWSLGNDRRPKKQKPKMRKKKWILYGVGIANPYSARVRYGSHGEYSAKDPEDQIREAAESTFANSEDHIAKLHVPRRYRRHRWNKRGIKVIGDLGLEYNHMGPSDSSNPTGDWWLDEDHAQAKLESAQDRREIRRKKIPYKKP